MNNEIMERLKDARMGFSAGVSALVVTVPPNWDSWLNGEVGEYTMGLWIVAFAAVTRGVLAIIQKIGGFKLPFLKIKQKEEKTDAE